MVSFRSVDNRRFAPLEELLGKLRDALSDRYDVERKLGEGGMATVFLARDVRHDRRVAIKVLHEDLGAALGAERFRREIQIATSLTHPHILTLYDSGEAASSLFYVMPFIEGESLRQRIDREKMLPIDQALKITQEVASALDYAHRKGVVHRDIKPENILLEDGHAIVADFGIARAVSTMNDGAGLTKTGMSLGTPTYMSPEQSFAEKDIDGRSDMYSLACVLYEMLVGQPPFTGANAQSIMAKHSMAEVPSMQIVRTTIPDEVEAVVQRALAKAPSDRFATVAEFAQELEECVIDYHTTTRRAVGDRRTSPRIPAGRRASDKGASAWPRRASIIGATLLLVAAAGGYGWWKWGRTGSASAATTGDLDSKRVAVTYFQDNSPSGQLGYLADGLTESLIERLSEVNALQVVSKGGVLPYRGTNVPSDSIARALSAGLLVRGTVEADGAKFKVRVRLINGNSGETIADETFEQPQSNVPAAQDTLTAKVADMLRSQVGSEVALHDARSGTSNTQAWTQFQQGQRSRKDADALLAKGDTAGGEKQFATADSLLGSAVNLDKSWSEPAVARSSLYMDRAMSGARTDAKPWIDKGLAQAEEVLSAHPRDAAALEVRGNLRYLKWSYSLADNAADRQQLLDGAESDLKSSVQIDPTRAAAWNTLSTVYSQKDDNINAKIAAQNAYDKDAYLTGTDEVLWKLYATSYDLEQFSDAVKYCDDGGKRFPDNSRFVRCRLWLLTVKSVKPDPTQAWKDYARLEQLTPKESWGTRQLEARMLVAAGLARAGLRDSATKVLATAQPDPSDDRQAELLGVQAFVRTLFGSAQDTTDAFNILKRYVSGNPQHRAGLAESQSWWWRGIKQDRRFADLVAGAR